MAFSLALADVRPWFSLKRLQNTQHSLCQKFKRLENKQLRLQVVLRIVIWPTNRTTSVQAHQPGASAVHGLGL